MRLDALLDRFWTAIDDAVEPHLCAEATAINLANEAVMEAVRRGFQIIDSDTAEICEIDFADGDVTVELDPRVISIRSAIVEGQSVPLVRRKTAWMDAFMPGWRTQTAAVPTAYIDDWTSGTIRPYPTPSAAGTILLSVAREPLAAMTRTTQTPELPARYHEKLVHRMAAQWFAMPDPETQDLTRSATEEAKFTAEFGERKSARNEKWASEQADAASLTAALC